MARDYTNTMKQALAANNTREAQQVAAAFQNKVAKYLESTLAAADAADRARFALAMYTSSRAAFGDLTKMLCVLRARDALAEFNKALPARIDKLDDEKLAELRARLDAFRAKYADAMPFALTMVAKRLKTPWQLIRFATKTARSKAATDIAATPYAVSVSMVLEQLDERRLALRHALKANRIPIAKDILSDIYDIEHTLRVSIDLLDESEWGRQLAELMEAIATMLEAELRSLPGNIRHVLGSRSSRGGSLTDRLTRLAGKGRDVLTDGASYCRKLVS
jgi:flagellin-specific chaperone FliS